MILKAKLLCRRSRVLLSGYEPSLVFGDAIARYFGPWIISSLIRNRYSNRMIEQTMRMREDLKVKAERLWQKLVRLESQPAIGMEIIDLGSSSIRQSGKYVLEIGHRVDAEELTSFDQAKIVAAVRPPSSEPAKSQFLRLCQVFHNRSYAKSINMST